MKTYRVGFYYEEKGYATIKANSKEEAKILMNDHLSEYGLENLTDYSCNDREFDTLDAYEVNYD